MNRDFDKIQNVPLNFENEKRPLAETVYLTDTLWPLPNFYATHIINHWASIFNFTLHKSCSKDFHAKIGQFS